MSEEKNVEEEVVEEVETVEETTTGETETPESKVTESNTEEENIDWKERALKAESLIVKHKKEPKQKVTKGSSDETRLDRIELRQEGYTPEIIDSIMELGGKEALKNPILKKAVDEMVVQANAEKASDIQSGTQSSSVNKYSKQDLEKMSVEELEKILPHAEQ